MFSPHISINVLGKTSLRNIQITLQMAMYIGMFDQPRIAKIRTEQESLMLLQSLEKQIRTLTVKVGNMTFFWIIRWFA